MYYVYGYLFIGRPNFTQFEIRIIDAQQSEETLFHGEADDDLSLVFNDDGGQHFNVIFEPSFSFFPLSLKVKYFAFIFVYSFRVHCVTSYNEKKCKSSNDGFCQ